METAATLKETRERDQLRRIFTRTAASIDTHLKTNQREQALIDFQYLKEKVFRLKELDKVIQDKLYAAENYSEEETAKEIDKADKYRHMWHTIESAMKCEGKPEERKPIVFQRNYRLPHIEIKKFDDNIKNWLSFWGQFKKIHEDDTIPNEDKFQYLLQCMKDDSDAWTLVNSFPPSAENYLKAVEQLKARFGREDLLIQIYVRDLLNLILNQKKSSNVSLRSLYDKITSYLLSLETLGIVKQKYETILYPLVESAIPSQTLAIWNRSCSSTDSTDLENLLTFLKTEVESEEKIKLSRSGFVNNGGSVNSIPNSISRSGFDTQLVPTAAALISNTKSGKIVDTCCFCDKNHVSFECGKLYSMPLEEKLKVVKQKGCCLICLKKGHMANKCRQFVKCMCCGKRHYIIMCPKVHNKEEEIASKNVLVCSRNHTTTLLQTLMVYVSYEGRSKKVRVLLDSGSQRSYVKAAVVKELGLRQTGTEMMGHSLFGGVKQGAQRYRCFDLRVSDLQKSFSYNINVIEQQNICGHLPKIRNDQLVDKLREMNIEISDNTYEDTEISLLIGSDFLASIMTNQLVHLSNNLIAVRTNLGWTLQGPMTTSNTLTNTVSLTCFSQDNLSDLWSLELLGIKDPFEKQSKKEKEAEVLKLFNNNVSVNQENRYEGSLLWKEGCPKLSTNYEMACKRLHHLTKKLKATGNLQVYDQVLQNWKKDEIIEKVTNDNIEVGHYIPHHCDIKPSSNTTKIRPVFDASAKDKNGWTLNGCLDKGINMIELLPKLLILFRKGTYGVISDIKQAFLQISVKEEDTEYLKFLWWNNVDTCDKIVSYRHKRVVFGVTCSPFLLSATINHHLRKYEQYEKTAKKLKDSFYVDNCVTSCETVNELETFISESKKIMSEGMFDLRGWITAPHRCDDTQETAVLGIIWNTLEDNLRCNVSIQIPGKITKRYVISVAQHVFDPLGLVCPATLLPKLVMQKIWNLKIDWDEEVPSEVKQEFENWLTTAHLINHCRIPRRISGSPIESCKTSLHIFCDACKTSYAACVFLRTQNKGTVEVKLILAKNRVAPNKNKMSLPRLELMGALIAARLYKEVLESTLLENCEYNVYFYTDSSVVLAWIQRQSQWKTFVSNRVKEICMTTNRNDWYHIPGEYNPADLPSRGCSAKKLLETPWWDGPNWLKGEEKQWPKSCNLDVNEEEVQREIKHDTVTNLEVSATQVFSQRLMYFSKYNRIVRLVAWILRWRIIIKEKDRNTVIDITNDEYENAQNVLIKLLQRENFTKEMLPRCMNTKVDDNGIIRVRTRLDLSHEHENFVSPILLPGRNEIVKRLVIQRHKKLNHCGTQFLLSNLRNDFWILNIRRLTKDVVSKCVICKRHKSKHYEVHEAPLPVDRIQASSAFQITGIDLAGPLFTRDQGKCWIVLFTCATYRAVHLELVESLSTNAFLMTLRRFIARRGRISVIYTDCGSNFQGAANLLKTVNWPEIEAATAIVPPIIKWRFSPPRAPWWGGWWERLIKVVKDILKRMLGKQTLSLVELNTLLCECEAVINNRPLTYVTTCDEFVQPLTPMMFLNPLTSTDTPDLDQIDANNLNLRLRYLNKVRDDFKQRFRNEYVGLICSKHRCKQYLPKVNDVVLIENDSSRLYWPLGIIKDLITGADGESRVAKVQTATGELTRAVQRLYPLELTTVGDEWRRADGKVGVDDGPGDTVVDAIPDLHLHDDDQSSRTRLGRIVKLPRRFLD